MDSVSVEGHFFYWSYVILTIADSAMETQVLIDTYHIFSKKKKKKNHTILLHSCPETFAVSLVGPQLNPNNS